MFVTWIMSCVSTVSYSILLNGKPCKSFHAKKGLRQGGSLIPFLFEIGMDYLSRCPSTLKDNSNFHYHPKCARFHISHMMFADDLLMFCRGDLSSIHAILKAFKLYSQAFGLEANLHKSYIYLGGVPTNVISAIKATTQIPFDDFPFRYLGVLLSTKKLSYAT